MKIEVLYKTESCFRKLKMDSNFGVCYSPSCKVPLFYGSYEKHYSFFSMKYFHLYILMLLVYVRMFFILRRLLFLRRILNYNSYQRFGILYNCNKHISLFQQVTENHFIKRENKSTVSLRFFFTKLFRIILIQFTFDLIFIKIK